MYHILVIDSSKGNEEGRESEKLVAWYPTGKQGDERVREAGFLQGLLHFSDIFDGQSSESNIVDLDMSLWVIGKFPRTNLYMSMMIDKQKLGRHVTNMNLIGIVKNIVDVYTMIQTRGSPTDKMLELVKMYGDRLNHKQSWLRKQLRNPFGLTWGATHCRLPRELEYSMVASAESFPIRLALFKDEVCLYSSLGHETTDKLGSLVLSGLHICFFVTTEDFIETENYIAGTALLFDEGDRYFVMISQGFSIFMLPSNEDDLLDLKEESLKIIQAVMDYIESFHWSVKNSRHVPGLRYLYQNIEQTVCSPRDKVSSSSHHIRAMATTLRDNAGSIKQIGSAYTCDKSGDSWGVLGLGKDHLSVSISLRGLNRGNLMQEFQSSSELHFQVYQ